MNERYYCRSVYSGLSAPIQMQPNTDEVRALIQNNSLKRYKNTTWSKVSTHIIIDKNALREGSKVSLLRESKVVSVVPSVGSKFNTVKKKDLYFAT